MRIVKVGLSSFFTKEGRKDRALKKACAKAANKKIKPDDRRPALHDLLVDGGDEAVLGLLRRFTFNYDTNIVMDEEEKNYVYEGLLAIGDNILPVVRKHLKTAPSLSWGMRLVNDLCDRETVWEVLEEVLEDFDPEYERDPSRKIQLMTFLGEFKDERSVEALMPFIEDHDETVRFVTVESLFQQGDERSRKGLLQLLINPEEESLRIKNRIVEGMIEAGWKVKGFRGSVEKTLAEDLPEYMVDGKSRMRLRKARKK